MSSPLADSAETIRDRKGVMNLFYFIASIAAVVAIIAGGKEMSRLETAGTGITVATCYVVLYYFLRQFRSEILRIPRKTLFLLFTILAFLFITRKVSLMEGRNVIYFIPFAVIPVLVRIFYDARLALFILLITIMLAAFMIPQPFEFILMSFISGMAAIFTLANIYRHFQLLFTSLIVMVSYSVLYTGLWLMNGNSPGEIFLQDYYRFLINGVMVLVCYPLIMIFENRFLFLSDATMLELADTSQPVLRKLAEEAPGSFQHSLQVANLAEEAARAIGANVLLVRAGALYHDIGKIANPNYYIENQKEGVSPHEKLDPRASSRLIINHVKNGIVLARNYKIPGQIIEFIRTHHGTTVAYFFYKKYLDRNPDKTDSKKDFTYPGPKPFSKETAVVMMADAVEASSRSLGNYSEESISELVERILLLQEQDGQFSDIPLTYKDISGIKEIFKKRLSNIYHARIAYPERS